MVEPGFPVGARRVTGVLSVAALLTVAAACSSSTSGKSSPAPSTSGSSPGAVSAPAASTVSSGAADVSGKQTTVLTAPDGHTLYYFTPDTAGGRPTCTGTCAALWPPLVAPGPSEASGVTGKLTVSTGGNANQVVYNGHPLYEYTPDTAAGQARGEGVMGEWHAATPGLAAGAGASSSTSGGGYGSGGY